MWGQLAMAGLGAVSGGKSNSSGGTPRWVKKRIKRGFGGVERETKALAKQGLNPQNADQLAGYDMVRNAAGTGMQNIGLAGDAARRAAAGVTQDDIRSFYNPYEQDVIDTSAADLNRQRGIAAMGIKDAAEKASAFGGDRAVVAEALSNEDYTRQMQQMISGLRYGGYNSAVNSAFRNNDAYRSGAASLLDVAGNERSAVYGDAAARTGVGDALFNYDKMAQEYALQMMMLRNNAAQGLMGVQSPTSSGGGVAGALSGALGGYQMGAGMFGGGGGSGMASINGLDMGLVGLG